MMIDTEAPETTEGRPIAKELFPVTNINKRIAEALLNSQNQLEKLRKAKYLQKRELD